jgi:hypothetical protein
MSFRWRKEIEKKIKNNNIICKNFESFTWMWKICVVLSNTDINDQPIPFHILIYTLNGTIIWHEIQAKPFVAQIQWKNKVFKLILIRILGLLALAQILFLMCRFFLRREAIGQFCPNPRINSVNSFVMWHIL